MLLVAAVVAAGLLALVGAKPAWAAERSFTPAPNSPFAVGSTPTTVTNADFNGDGKVDLATSNHGSDNVSVYLGKGDGDFQTRQDFPAGDGPSSVTSADFNKDGIADLAVSNQNYNTVSSSYTVSILLGKDDGTGKGDGTFEKKPDEKVGGFQPSSITSADFNKDGIADLAVSNYGSHNVSVLLGKGDGTFHQPGVDYGVSVAGVNPNEVITADFNNDGKMDLATANIGTELASNLGGVAVLLGNGDGTFQAASKAVTHPFTESVATADFNGDGKKDLVATGPACCGGGKVSVALGNGDGTFQAKQEFLVGSGNTAPKSVSSADFDNDGKQDLAVSNSTNSVSLLWGSGTGSFQTSQEFTAGSGPVFVIGAKLNADTFADLVVANQTSNDVSVLLNNGAGTPSCTKSGTSADDTISGTSGKDVICGLAGNDTIKGLGDDDILIGGDGNDKLIGGAGNDTLDGGLGTDTVSYGPSLTAVNASLATNSATGEGSDTFSGIENLTGSSYADTLTGTGAINTLTGGAGDDTVRGGEGNDKVVGSGGADSLFGEGGNDTVNSKDGVNGNDSLDGGIGTDTKVTDTTEKAVTGFP